MNDHVARKLPFRVPFFWLLVVFVFVRVCVRVVCSVQTHTLLVREDWKETKKQGEKTLHEIVHAAVAAEHSGFWRCGGRNMISLA